jgi:hypothetical protein
MKVTIYDRDGREITKNVDQGTKLGDLVDLSRDAIVFNTKAVPAGYNPELRDGDEIEYVRKSQKPGC